MGTPKTAYGAYNVWLKGTKADLSPIEREAGVAKFIRTTSGNNGYFLDSDIVGDDQSAAVAKVKALFKLDRLESIKADGITGFIGQIECDSTGIPIGPNARYHRAYNAVTRNRYSGIVDQVKDALGNIKYYHYFNDAGLNTTGWITLGPYSPNVEPDLLNHGVKLSAIIYAAFYSGQNKWGFRMKANGTDHPENPVNYSENTYTTVYQETMGINTVRTLNQTPITVDRNYMLIAPNKYLTQIYIENEEGIVEEQMWEVMMLPYERAVSFGETLTEAAASGSSNRWFNTTTLIWKDAITGNPADATTSMSMVATNQGMTIPAAPGYYMFTEVINNRRGYVHVIAGGLIDGWNEPTLESPTDGYDLSQLRTPTPYYGFFGSSTSNEDRKGFAYDSAVMNGFVDPIGTLYQDQETLLMYTGEYPSPSFPTPGYYILSEGYPEDPVGTCGYYRIGTGGVIQEPIE